MILNESYVQERIVHLRITKGVSAREMSMALDQAESYINMIENKKSLPSWTGFFKICEYLGVTPRDFFDEDSNYPERLNTLIELLKKLDDTSFTLIEGMAQKLTGTGK